MNNRKDFITKDAELKYLRERVSYLELENENLRLKMKLQENEKKQPEKKRKYVLVDPFWGWEIPCGPADPGPYGYEVNDFPWWFRTVRTTTNSSSNKI